VVFAVLYVLFAILRVLELLIIGRVIASWLSADRTNFIVRVLFETTEPVLAIVRPWTRRVPGPLDWSPWLVLVLIEATRLLLASFLD
jgi:YggT family protein